MSAINTTSAACWWCHGVSLKILRSCALAADGEVVDHGHYRLGDMVMHASWRQQDSGKARHQQEFPDSIATTYMQRTNESLRISVLDDIVRQRHGTAGASPLSSSCAPAGSMGIVHIRLGDVMGDAPVASGPTAAMVHASSTSKYVRPLQFYEGIARKFNATRTSMAPIVRVVLVSATYRAHATTVLSSSSFAHLQAIHGVFRRAGYGANSVGIRLNREADADFVYMAQSSYFVCSGGGFSRLVATLVRHRHRQCVCQGVRGCSAL